MHRMHFNTMHGPGMARQNHTAQMWLQAAWLPTLRDLPGRKALQGDLSQGEKEFCTSKICVRNVVT